MDFQADFVRETLALGSRESLSEASKKVWQESYQDRSVDVLEQPALHGEAHKLGPAA